MQTAADGDKLKLTQKQKDAISAEWNQGMVLEVTAEDKEVELVRRYFYPRYQMFTWAEEKKWFFWWKEPKWDVWEEGASIIAGGRGQKELERCNTILKSIEPGLKDMVWTGWVAFLHSSRKQIKGYYKQILAVSRPILVVDAEASRKYQEAPSVSDEGGTNLPLLALEEFDNDPVLKQVISRIARGSYENLYVAYEAIMIAVAGKKDKGQRIVQLGWASEEELERFHLTANDLHRHHKMTNKLKASGLEEMVLAEAELLIRRLFRYYLTYRSKLIP